MYIDQFHHFVDTEFTPFLQRISVMSCVTHDVTEIKAKLSELFNHPFIEPRPDQVRRDGDKLIVEYYVPASC